MSALCYLSRKQIKNFIKELAHNPGKLVLYIILIITVQTTEIRTITDPLTKLLSE